MTHQRFTIEAVLIAIYGQLLVPGRPVEYVIPYSTILELYEMKNSSEPVMPIAEDDAHVKKKIGELIEFFENPFTRKKMEQAMIVPWRKSQPLLVNDQVIFTVVNALDNAQYGEQFDPIETELVLTSINEKAPLLTDQFELTDKVIEQALPVQIFDLDDFEFALEEGDSEEDWHTH